MNSIKTSAEPYVRVTKPEYVEMRVVLVDQLDQLENYSDIGLQPSMIQPSMIWIAIGAFVGAMPATTVFVIDFFTETELGMPEKISGLFEVIIFVAGGVVASALWVPYRKRKRQLNNIISKMRDQRSV